MMHKHTLKKTVSVTTLPHPCFHFQTWRPILHYTVVLSKIPSKAKMDLLQGHPKIMPKAEFRPPSLWLDTHTSTKGGVGSTADKDLLSHFRVVFLKSSNYQVKGLWTLGMLGVLVGISVC